MEPRDTIVPISPRLRLRAAAIVLRVWPPTELQVGLLHCQTGRGVNRLRHFHLPTGDGSVFHATKLTACEMAEGKILGAGPHTHL